MISGEEAKEIMKKIFLRNIEELVKHQAKLQLLYRSDKLSDKEEIKKWRKEEEYLCHMVYPEIEAMRAFIEKEHPEFIYMVDHIQSTVEGTHTEEKES